MKSHLFLDTLRSKGSQLRLDNIRAAMRELGNPQQKYKCVVIAGTNGKGSTAAMISNGLGGGLLTSPHLIELNERIKLDGKDIIDSDFTCLIETIQPIAEKHNLTYYETVVAVAFLYFAERKVEYSVLEVGLGGRLDGVNIVDPIISVITNIELEHTETLGDTIEKIATEKAGIIKGNIVITSEEKLEALTVLEKVCATNCASFIKAKPHDFQLQMQGAHQQKNASCAYETLRALGKTPEEARAAVETAIWPGRLERIGNYLLDGAHNPSAAKELADYLRGKELNLIIAVKDNKDYPQICASLCPLAKKVFVTQFGEGSLPTETLAAEVVKHNPNCELVPEPEDALEKSEGLTVITGSLYLVGLLREKLI